MMSTHLKRWRPQFLRFGLLLFVGCILLLPARGLAAPKATLADLPLPAQAAIAATLGKDQPAYHTKQHGAGFTFDNHRHAFTAVLTPEGLTLKQGSVTATLQLTGWGYGTTSQPLRPAKPIAHDNRVEYRRGSLTEWYVNGPLGLEQGLTLSAPPSPRRTGPLTLAFAIGGELTTRVETGKTAATFLTWTGASVLRYTGLTVTDATGAALPAWLKQDGSRLLIQVDDASARYPLTIDPFIQQAKLTASDGAAFDNFGASVAISGDTVVVAAPGVTIGANFDQGAAYVFVRPLGGWAGLVSEQAKLTASDGAADDGFGYSVAISGDTVVVGANLVDIGANINQGAAYVFAKPLSGWTGSLTEQAKLTASDGAAGDGFGLSVAISGDTVVVGSWIVNFYQGASYVFVKPVTGWAGFLSEQAKLTASDGAAGDWFGISVAINGDTVVVGTPRANIDQGAAYVFVKPVTGWAGFLTEQAKLTALDGASPDLFGISVAINGDTVVVGAGATIGANFHQGAAYVFVKPLSGWTGSLTEQAKLTASDGVARDEFGASVAISGDTVVVGIHSSGIAAITDPGAAYLFVKPLSGWAGFLTEQAKLTASDGAAGDTFGFSVAIASHTVVVGALFAGIGANIDQGAAYVYHFSAPDLTGQWLTLTQSCRSTRVGQRCWLRGTAEITNQGDRKAPTSSFLRFYLSADATFDPATDTFLRQVAVGALRPGMSQRKRLSVPLPAGQNATGKVVLAVIDATNVVAERDETNNLLVFGPLP